MKEISIWFHIGFWVLYMTIFTLVGASYKEEYLEALTFELLNLPMRLIVVYFNYFVLLPKCLLKDRFKYYFLYTLLTLIVASFFQRIINYEVLSLLYPDMNDHGIWLFYKFLQIAVIIASPLIFLIGLSIIWKVAALQKRTQSLENEKLQSELRYLKSQISPHFLFNTLNHIYGLSLDNSPKTSDLILKLSDFLSFSLYESNQNRILLEKEIALMQDFITLEKSRFEDRVQVHLSLPQERIETLLIPPLILVPFVENAFKHSLKEEIGMAKIDIQLTINEASLIFQVKNSKPSNDSTNYQYKGLGLINIKKRLDILYPNEYELTIDDAELQFSISLKINL